MAAPEMNADFKNQDTVVDRRTLLGWLGLGAAASLAPQFLGANDAEAAGISSRQAGKLAIEARKYAKSGNGVAVIAFVGSDIQKAGYTPTQIGQAFENKLSKLGVQARAFVADNGDENTAISLITKLQSYGPYNLNSALSTVEQAAKQHLTEKKFASLDEADPALN